MIVGIDVQPPEQLFPPRRQRFEADRLDVGQREQTEHLQPLLDPDQLGEVLDDVRILGVAAEGDERHLEMVLDEEFARWRAIRPAGRAARTSAAPSARSRREWSSSLPLADVVVEQRQDQQLGRDELGEQPAEAIAARRRRRRQALQIADRQQRVLVDRVLVIEVAHHAREDQLELREDAARAARGRAFPTAARRGPAAA